MKENLIRVSNWIAFAKSLGYEVPADVTSRRLREAAADASIPAEMVANVWRVRTDHTDLIASAMGMKRPVAASRRAA